MTPMPDPDDALALAGWMFLRALQCAAVALALIDMVLIYYTHA